MTEEKIKNRKVSILDSISGMDSCSMDRLRVISEIFEIIGEQGHFLKAADLIIRYGTYERMSRLNIKELKANGLSTKSARLIVNIFNISKSIGLEETEQRIVSKASDVFELLYRTYIGLKKEVLKIVLLNSNLSVIKVYNVLIGSVDSIGNIRLAEIVKLAVYEVAPKCIIVHNHPSGNLSPSKADISFTNRLKAGLKLLDIDLLDHIIIAGGKYYSFSENRIL